MRHTPLGLALAFCAVSALSCESAPSSSRSAWLISSIVRADYPSLRTRPSLMRTKFALMRDSLYDYYRGTYPIFVRDALEGDPRAGFTRFAPGGLVPGIGDSHPENAGVLVAADNTLGLEFNDFDASDRLPYHWDLRRLCAGLVVALSVSNANNPAAKETLMREARPIARAAAESYLAAIRRYANGAALERVSDGQMAPNLDDLFRRGARDLARSREITDLTTLTGTVRKLRRGVLDPAEPTAILSDLAPTAMEALPSLFLRYRTTLEVPRDEAFFTVLDAVRQFGSGIASLPRVRVLVLVRGPTDAPEDDMILEVKELGDSGAPGTVPPNVWADSVSQRIRTNAWTAWGASTREPFWSSDLWLGVPVQIRAEREAHKTLRADRMVDALGTPDAILRTARVLGALLARAHMTTEEGRSTAQTLIRSADTLGVDAFADEHADASVAYAAQVVEDWTLFRNELMARGDLLGFELDPSDAPHTDARALLFGVGPSGTTGP